MGTNAVNPEGRKWKAVFQMMAFCQAESAYQCEGQFADYIAESSHERIQAKKSGEPSSLSVIPSTVTIHRDDSIASSLSGRCLNRLLLSGNPAAVCLLDRGWGTSWLQAVAAEKVRSFETWIKGLFR